MKPAILKRPKVRWGGAVHYQAGIGYWKNVVSEHWNEGFTSITCSRFKLCYTSRIFHLMVLYILWGVELANTKYSKCESKPLSHVK